MSSHALRAAPGRRMGLVGLVIAAAVALLVLAAPQAAEAKKKPKTSVATMNLYIGTGLDAAIVAPDQAALAPQVQQALANINASDPEARLKLQAKIIKQQKPDVVGLQEVEQVFTGPVGDPAQANTKVYDFLSSLMKRLKGYKVATKVRNVDVERPGTQNDIRIVDYDAIIYKKKTVKVQKTDGGNFATSLILPVPLDGSLGNVNVLRGYNEANMKIRGKKYHVVNTHLEAFAAAQRNAQADELAKKGGPLDSKRKTILLGDLNSDPKGTPGAAGASPEAYDTVTKVLKKDLGVKQDTCCLDDDLKGGTFTSRVDHVIGDKGLKKQKAKRQGVSKKMLTPGGLFPSDHASVFSWLKY